MSSIQDQEKFKNLIKKKLSKKENDWLDQKTAVITESDTKHKFPVFFSLSSRFVSHDISEWSQNELVEMELVYPGFANSKWTNLDMARVVLMIALKPDTNKPILDSLFESAEMMELVAFFKGLYLLENAQDFTKNVEEGIRTNMVNVFDSFTAGNPYTKTYLEEWAWNQLILKVLFLDRPVYTIYQIDQGKNERLANILQDFIRERWAASRQVSPEIWRMIQGYLREDIIDLIQDRNLKGLEKSAIEYVMNNEEHDKEFWNTIGTQYLKI